MNEDTRLDADALLAERDRLRAVNAELVEALGRCDAHFTRICPDHVEPSALMICVRLALARAKGKS